MFSQIEGPIIASILFDAYGNYKNAYYLCSAMSFIGGFIQLFYPNGCIMSDPNVQMLKDIDINNGLFLVEQQLAI
jgi:hypothetical protein